MLGGVVHRVCACQRFVCCFWASPPLPRPLLCLALQELKKAKDFEVRKILRRIKQARQAAPGGGQGERRGRSGSASRRVCVGRAVQMLPTLNEI